MPALLSWSRVPLAAAFVLLIDRPLAALAVLIAAAVTDLLDGWWARRHDQVTATGSALDAVTDKVFVLTVAIALAASDRLSPWAILLLSTRELGELPLLLRFALKPRARAERAGNASANIWGKIATLFQFTAVCSALFGLPSTDVWVAAAAVTGALAAASYWRRELKIRAIIPRSVSSRRRFFRRVRVKVPNSRMDARQGYSAQRGGPMNGLHNEGSPMGRATLRTLVASIDREIARLPRLVFSGSEAGADELATAWRELTKLLDLGPEPEVRECPVCAHIVMKYATLCGYCWTKLSPA